MFGTAKNKHNIPHLKEKSGFPCRIREQSLFLYQSANGMEEQFLADTTLIGGTAYVRSPDTFPAPVPKAENLFPRIFGEQARIVAGHMTEPQAAVPVSRQELALGVGLLLLYPVLLGFLISRYGSVIRSVFRSVHRSNYFRRVCDLSDRHFEEGIALMAFGFTVSLSLFIAPRIASLPFFGDIGAGWLLLATAAALVAAGLYESFVMLLFSRLGRVFWSHLSVLNRTVASYGFFLLTPLFFFQYVTGGRWNGITDYLIYILALIGVLRYLALLSAVFSKKNVSYLQIILYFCIAILFPIASLILIYLWKAGIV